MKSAWLVMAAMVLTGCAGTRGLQLTLEGRTGELLYLHDSETVDDKQKGTVKIVSFVVDDVLPPDTTVRKKSGFLVPLLFVNFWKYEYECRLGSSQIENDYKEFARQSFIEELERSGTYRQAEDYGDLEVEVGLRSLTMSAPMVKVGDIFFVLYAYGYNESTLAGPVESVVTADVVIRRDGHELVNRRFQGSSRTNTLKGNFMSVADYTATMIEGFSLALKDLNEHLVQEINRIPVASPRRI